MANIAVVAPVRGRAVLHPLIRDGAGRVLNCHGKADALSYGNSSAQGDAGEAERAWAAALGERLDADVGICLPGGHVRKVGSVTTVIALP